MEWSKVKNVLILLFLCTNVLLLGLYALRQYGSGAQANAAEENLRLALSRQGVEVTGLPAGDVRVYMLSARRLTSSEEALAAALLTAPVATDVGGGIVEYMGKEGQARFRSGGLFDARPDTRFDAPRDEADTQTPMALLQALGFVVVPQSLSLTVTPEETLAEALAELEGRPVFNAGIHLQYTEGRLSGLSGRWVWGELYRAGGLCRPAGEILLRFCGERRREGTPVYQVTDMTLGYVAARSQTEGYTDFIPVWQCTADGEVFYVNAETGQIQNLET